MRTVNRFLATAIAGLLLVGILTLWVPYRWAVSLFQTGVFALALAWTLRQVVRPQSWHSSVLLVPLTATVGWGLAQLALGQTVYPWETWNALLKWGTNLALFFLALQVFSDPVLREGFLRTVLYFGAALSVVASVQMYTSEGRVFWLFPTEYTDFVLGPFVYRNQYAAFMELLLPLALVGALQDRRRMLIHAAMAASMYASVIAGASRAGSVLVTGEVLVIFFLCLRRDRSAARPRLLALGVMAGFALLFTAVVGWDTLWKRFLQQDPYAVRREFVQSSLGMVRDRPAMGFGLGTWSTAYPGYAFYDKGFFANQAHNDWAQWAVEGGLPFFLLMLWIALRSLRPAFRSLWGLGVPCVFLHSLVDYPVERPALAGFFFVFLAVLETARRAQRNEKERPLRR
ncbi:MAG: O-antigen ligase family protein [Acidobacteria bacterium]|nr:O-antigen ligase family protein [Acidobacteriota bacterium]